MPKDIRVLIVEDDPYARDLMAMLLTRDWRTRLAGEFGSRSEAELERFLALPTSRVHVVIVDTEVPADERWPFKVSQIAHALARPPALLFTCTRPDDRVFEQILRERGSGYVIKGEILYALASAVSAAAEGNFVITPGVCQIAGAEALPRPATIVDGSIPVASFTPRENDLARLGILFNLVQRDIADELVISTDFVAECLGKVYDKLGLHEIVTGETPLETYFTDETLLARFRAILGQAVTVSRPGKRARRLAGIPTLAFHLLTMAEEERLY